MIFNFVKYNFIYTLIIFDKKSNIITLTLYIFSKYNIKNYKVIFNLIQTNNIY